MMLDCGWFDAETESHFLGEVMIRSGKNGGGRHESLGVSLCSSSTRRRNCSRRDVHCTSVVKGKNISEPQREYREFVGVNQIRHRRQFLQTWIDNGFSVPKDFVETLEVLCKDV